MNQKASLKRYLEAVYNRCFQMLRNPDQAWDALQDVFEMFYLASQKKEIEYPMAYLYRMSTNRCLNILRGSNRTLPLLVELEGPANLQTQTAEGRLMVGALIDLVGEEAVNMMIYRHVDQMTFEEIGSLLGMSDRGVKKKLDRLETQVREHFQLQWQDEA